MLTLSVAMALAVAQNRDPQSIIRDTFRLRDAYISCLTEQTVRLGSGNSESADTILRAVAVSCQSSEDALRSVYSEAPLSRLDIERLMTRDRTQGEEAGVAALLEARAARGN